MYHFLFPDSRKLPLVRYNQRAFFNSIEFSLNFGTLSFKSHMGLISLRRMCFCIHQKVVMFAMLLCSAVKKRCVLIITPIFLILNTLVPTDDLLHVLCNKLWLFIIIKKKWTFYKASIKRLKHIWIKPSIEPGSPESETPSLKQFLSSRTHLLCLVKFTIEQIIKPTK